MPDYDFSSLSPSDFEILMRDLLTAEHKLHFEAFAQGPDGGVDLRAFENGKKFIVQCKHYAGSTFADLKRSAAKERIKMEKEKPDRYLFVTTQDLTRGQKDTLHEELDTLVSSTSEILAQTDINELLSRHSTVEKNHFKLWLASAAVLERIVNSGIWERSEALMESIQSRVKLYVPNASYQRASDFLARARIVTITGAPGVGKSMLADMILLTRWEEGWQVVTINNDVNDGWTAWNRDQPQIFLFDDFLGQTDFSERKTKNEGANLSKFADRVMASTNKLLVLTTRSHILQQAQIRDEPLARSGIDARQCVVEVRDFNLLQRSHLLYNHLYFSSVDRAVIRDFATDTDRVWELVRHANFTPRIVELVLRRSHASGASLARDLRKAFDHPLELWGPSFESALSETARFILLSLVTFPVSGADEPNLRKTAIKESSPIEYKHALKALEGTWIRIQAPTTHHQKAKVSFANPSCRDFILSFLDATPEYMSLLLSGSVTSRQICTLLSYCIAESLEPPYRKFSGLWNYVKQHASDIHSALQSIWQGKLATEELFQGKAAAIAILLKVDGHLKLGWRKWILAAVLDTARARKKLHGYRIPEFEDVKEIVAFIDVEISEEGAAENSEECAIWADLWIDSANTDDEWLELKRYAFAQPAGVVARSCDMQAEFMTAAQHWFEAELDDIQTTYRNDFKAINDRIDEIRTVGPRLNLGNCLDEEVARAYEMVSEKEREQPEGHIDYSSRSAEEAFDRSTSRTESSAPSGTNAKAALEDLFSHLQ